MAAGPGGFRFFIFFELEVIPGLLRLLSSSFPELIPLAITFLLLKCFYADDRPPIIKSEESLFVEPALNKFRGFWAY